MNAVLSAALPVAESPSLAADLSGEDDGVLFCP